MGFVLSGKCIAKKTKMHGDDIPLNVFNVSDTFGVLSVLTNRPDFPTCITSVNGCEVAFLSKKDVDYLIDNYPVVARNFIDFLATRITFMNDKISTFSAYNVEQKLATYLLQLSNKIDSETLIFSRTQCAKVLNAGRASLYRALDALVEKGVICLDGKKVIIKNFKELERSSK